MKHIKQLLVVIFFQLTNFWDDPPGATQVPLGPGGSENDPECIFVIIEAQANFNSKIFSFDQLLG